MAEEIINNVAASGLETIDLEDFFPKQEISMLDLKDWLFHGLILKEKDFRAMLDQHDWQSYDGRLVGVYCSADAIIPAWAYMLIMTRLEPHAAWVFAGSREEMLKAWYARELSNLNPGQYSGKRVVLKGCGNYPVPEEAYLEATRLLLPHVKSIMYGEPCSTVPVFKRKL
jgi:hypothetical protein